jgi:hypothetical protein
MRCHCLGLEGLAGKNFTLDFQQHHCCTKLAAVLLHPRKLYAICPCPSIPVVFYQLLTIFFPTFATKPFPSDCVALPMSALQKCRSYITVRKSVAICFCLRVATLQCLWLHYIIWYPVLSEKSWYITSHSLTQC